MLSWNFSKNFRTATIFLYFLSFLSIHFHSFYLSCHTRILVQGGQPIPIINFSTARCDSHIVEYGFMSQESQFSRKCIYFFISSWCTQLNMKTVNLLDKVSWCTVHVLASRCTRDRYTHVLDIHQPLTQ